MLLNAIERVQRQTEKICDEVERLVGEEKKNEE